MKLEKPYLAPLDVWQAYERLDKVKGNSPKNELTALVSLIRRVTEIDPVLTSYDQTVNRNFQDWVFKKQAGTLKFNEDQMNWLRMIKIMLQPPPSGTMNLDTPLISLAGAAGVQLFGRNEYGYH